MIVFRKNKITLLLFTAFLFYAGAVFPETSSGLPDNGVYAVRDSVLSYFFPVTGTIEETKDALIIINIPEGNELKKGTRLSVFREGAPFYHPSTRELIGVTENLVGIIEVTEKGDKEGIYHCRAVKGDMTPGDITRITSSRIKIAFFQDRKSQWELSELFYNALKDSGRFKILEAYTVSYEPQRLSELSRELGAEAFVMFSTPSKDDSRFMNVRLYWVEGTHNFAVIEKEISSVTVGLTPDKELIDINLSGREPWGSYDIAGGELIAIGDVDGNGDREMVVSDGTGLRVYDMKDEPMEKWHIKGGAEERHISIDILDLNKNGRAEIFVTSIIKNSGRMSSYVVEYEPSGGYRRIWENSPYFLRVLEKALLMQKYTRFGIFTGPVFKAVWTDEDYRPETPLELPGRTNIYGFNYIDWQKDRHPQIITFDDKGYLNLYSNGVSIWKSMESYGEFPLSFDKDAYSLFDNSQEMNRQSMTGSGSEWYIRGRLLTINTSRGEEVVVVKKIPLLSNVPGLGTDRTEIYSLWWDGINMDEEFVMRGISGPVTDYWIEGSDLFLIARKGILSSLKKAYKGYSLKGSRLYYYSFGKK